MFGILGHFNTVILVFIFSMLNLNRVVQKEMGKKYLLHIINFNKTMSNRNLIYDFFFFFTILTYIKMTNILTLVLLNKLRSHTHL